MGLKYIVIPQAVLLSKSRGVMPKDMEAKMDRFLLVKD